MNLAVALVAVAVVATASWLPAGALPRQQSSSTTATTSNVSSSTSGPSTTSAPDTTAAPAEPPSTAATSDASAPDAFADAGATQPFPAPLVGPVPAAEVPVERLMTNVYLTASTDAERPQVVVQFKSPFALPSRPYRVSVLVGDPTGAKLRASMLGNGSGVVSWKAEKSPAPPPGSPWTTPPEWTTIDTSNDGATFSPAGLAVVTIPLKDAPEGPSVWAEVETGSDGKQVSLSPYFSRAALLGQVPAGQLPSGLVGAVLNPDGTPSGQYVALPPGPVVSLQNRAIQVTTTERPPTQVAGQKVEKSFDFVRIAPTFNKRAVVTDYIFIDRTTGETKLLDGFTVPPGDKSGGDQWVTTGMAKDDPGAPVALQFDLKAVAKNLGIDLTANASGFGLRREYVLADGRHVVAEAVLGTVSWFGADAIAGIHDDVAADTGAPVGPLVDNTDNEGLVLILVMVGLGVAVLVVILVSVAVTVRRRRRRQQRGDAADQLELIAEETAQHRAVLREERLATGQVPIIQIDDDGRAIPPPSSDEPAPTPVAGLAALINRDRAPVVGATEDSEDAVDSEPAPVERPSAATPATGDPVWADDPHVSGERPIITAPTVQAADPAAATGPDIEVDDGAPLSPAAALESLGAEFDELSVRLQKLEGAGPP